MPEPTICCNNKAHDSLHPWATLSISLLLEAREDKLKGLSCYRLNSNLGESRIITCFINVTDTGSNLKGYLKKNKHKKTKKNSSYLQLLVWGAAPFKTLDQETDDINQAFRNFYYTGSALCLFPHVLQTFVFLSYTFSCCTSLAIPKSVTLQVSLSPTRTFRAARSRWIICDRFH